MNYKYRPLEVYRDDFLDLLSYMKMFNNKLFLNDLKDQPKTRIKDRIMNELLWMIKGYLSSQQLWDL